MTALLSASLYWCYSPQLKSEIKALIRNWGWASPLSHYRNFDRRHRPPAAIVATPSSQPPPSHRGSMLPPVVSSELPLPAELTSATAPRRHCFYRRSRTGFCPPRTGLLRPLRPTSLLPISSLSFSYIKFWFLSLILLHWFPFPVLQVPVMRRRRHNSPFSIQPLPSGLRAPTKVRSLPSSLGLVLSYVFFVLFYISVAFTFSFMFLVYAKSGSFLFSSFDSELLRILHASTIVLMVKQEHACVLS